MSEVSKDFSKLKSRIDAPETRIDAIRELLGSHAVLIPVGNKSKRPTLPNWQKLTNQALQSPEFRNELLNGNIGVSLGEQSYGLCTIDIDSDDALEKFMKDNSWAKNTLITKGVRGANIWVQIDGLYPKLKGFSGWGEWRSTGGQTVIYGIHESGCPYQYLNLAHPVSMKFEDIVWPFDFKTYKGCVSPNPTPIQMNYVSTLSTYLHNKDVDSYRKSDGTCYKAILDELHPGLKNLYIRYILKRYQGKPNQRNQFIVDADPEHRCHLRQRRRRRDRSCDRRDHN